MTTSTRIRPAQEGDLYRIWELGTAFGHLMTHMRQVDSIRPHLKDIIVHETQEDGQRTIDGFYHCTRLRTKKDRDQIQHDKVIPGFLMDSAYYRAMQHRLGICIQGGAHGEVFYELIEYLQEHYDELWCWCSIKSNRPKGYEKLGFTFNPKVKYKFWNYHKGGESTYQLGRWTRDGSK